MSRANKAQKSTYSDPSFIHLSVHPHGSGVAIKQPSNLSFIYRNNAITEESPGRLPDKHNRPPRVKTRLITNAGMERGVGTRGNKQS